MKESERDHWYKIGQSVGLEAASSILMDKAKNLFGCGCDQEAQGLRKLAEELKFKADDVHPKKS